MKRTITSLMACLLIASTFMTAVSADVSPNVVVNGVEIIASPVIKDSRTLVPVRGVFEELGYSVDWEENSKTAVIKNDSYEIRIQNGQDTFTCNGKVIVPDVPQQNIDSRFYLPLRAVSESIGAEVEWDANTKTVSINTTYSDETVEIPVSIPKEEIEKPISEQEQDLQDTSKDKTLIGTNPVNGKPIYQVGGCEDLPNTQGYSNGILVNGKRIWFDMSYKEAEMAIGTAPDYGDGKTRGAFINTSIGDIQIEEEDGVICFIALYGSENFDVQYGKYLYTHMDGEAAAKQNLGDDDVTYSREPGLVIKDGSIRDYRGYTCIPIRISPNGNSSVLYIEKEVIEL